MQKIKRYSLIIVKECWNFDQVCCGFFPGIANVWQSIGYCEFELGRCKRQS